MYQRLKFYFDSKKIQRKDFCQKTGYSEKNLSNALTGSVKLPRIDLIESLIRYDPNLNIRWLLLGEGEMMLNTEKEHSQMEKPNSKKLDLKQRLEELEKTVLELVKEMEKMKNEKG